MVNETIWIAVQIPKHHTASDQKKSKPENVEKTTFLRYGRTREHECPHFVPCCAGPTTFPALPFHQSHKAGKDSLPQGDSSPLPVLIAQRAMRESPRATTLASTTQSNMAWALYLTSGASSVVTDAQLAELDEFELVSRGNPRQAAIHLRSRIAHIAHALVCAAGAMPGRQQMLRSVNLLLSVLTTAAKDPPLLRRTVRGLASLHVHAVAEGRVSFQPPEVDEPTFLHPLVSIAVNRVSDKELSGSAAACLSVLLGCPSFENGIDDAVPESICEQANEQTRRLILSLVTEIVLTSSPMALRSLSSLLRRDFARNAFCEKDGVSTLASTLLTHPKMGHTAIGEIIANSAGRDAQSVTASYHAVFAIWMLTFAVSPTVLELVLSHVLSSRLLVVLGRLLNHSSGQRLKIARVTLSSLRNMASGTTALHARVRRDLLSAEVPAILQRLIRMGSGPGALLGADEDAMSDAQALAEILRKERASMSTLDAYIAEVRADALHWSPVHKDAHFWVTNAQRIVDEHRDVLKQLAAVLMRSERESAEAIVVACNDLTFVMRESVNGKAALLSIEGLKVTLMTLMTCHEDAEVRAATLTCIQYLVMSSLRP